MKISKKLSLILGATSLVGLTPLVAQTVQDNTVQEATLNVPGGQKLFGKRDPNVRRATAKVNGAIITETDIEHRLALSLQANKGQLSPEQISAFRVQVLGSLIDETLQMQEAEAQEMAVTDKEVNRYFASISRENYKRTPEQTAEYLKSIGSSAESVKRQIRGELAWQRLLQRNVNPFIEISDDEVNAIVERINTNKGRTEFHPAEIYLRATPENQEQVMRRAQQILEQLRKGGSFAAYARQFSESTTAAVGGDLGWLFPEQLPETMAAALPNMQSGQVQVIPTPGGLSIMALIDRRQVATADPRQSVLSLKQIAITFPQGAAEADVLPKVKEFQEKTAAITGCGAADNIASSMGAEIVNRDGIVLSSLPGPLQQVMLQLQVGQSTPPYGSVADGVRVFVLCGRDAPKVAEISADRIRQAEENKKIDKRAQLLLRDLRRDAIIDYN